ncbi:MAG: hypothetical protein ACKVVP_13415 [Chloroflexota bacterium]
MTQLPRFDGAMKQHPAVDAWLHDHADTLGNIARHWLQIIRDRGEDVRELIHDGAPNRLHRRCRLRLRQCLSRARERGFLSRRRVGRSGGHV